MIKDGVSSPSWNGQAIAQSLPCLVGLYPWPWLQMRGDWLAAAGFDIQTQVRVRVMQGCLVVTIDEA